MKEFREFAMRGNVIDMAVGVIIGGAFGKIVSSLVSDIVMPVLGILTGSVDFKDLKFVLSPAEGDQAAVTLNYGLFIQNILLLLFLWQLRRSIKLENRLKRKRLPPKKNYLQRFVIY